MSILQALLSPNCQVVSPHQYSWPSHTSSLASSLAAAMATGQTWCVHVSGGCLRLSLHPSCRLIGRWWSCGCGVGVAPPHHWYVCVGAAPMEVGPSSLRPSYANSFSSSASAIGCMAACVCRTSTCLPPSTVRTDLPARVAVRQQRRRGPLGRWSPATACHLPET